jgi:hypothetical protein
MLATLTDGPFDDADWVFEDKYDGFRMVAETDGGKVALFSRNGKIISHSYVEVARALEAVKGDAVIDGELVALDKAGVPTRFDSRQRQGRVRFAAPLRVSLRGSECLGEPQTAAAAEVPGAICWNRTKTFFFGWELTEPELHTQFEARNVVFFEMEQRPHESWKGLRRAPDLLFPSIFESGSASRGPQPSPGNQKARSEPGAWNVESAGGRVTGPGP